MPVRFASFTPQTLSLDQLREIRKCKLAASCRISLSPHLLMSPERSIRDAPPCLRVSEALRVIDRLEGQADARPDAGDRHQTAHTASFRRLARGGAVNDGAAIAPVKPPQ